MIKCFLSVLCFLSIFFCQLPAHAGDDIVESDVLIQQLRKPAPVKTRGFVVSGKQQAVQPSATIYVYFISGTVKFADTESRRQLDELGKALTSKTLKNARFEISGHTDSVGSDAYNLDLSNRRAQAVNAYLKNHFEYSSSAINGYGESRPIASNATSEGRAKNRRVVITRLD